MSNLSQIEIFEKSIEKYIKMILGKNNWLTRSHFIDIG